MDNFDEYKMMYYMNQYSDEDFLSYFPRRQNSKIVINNLEELNEFIKNEDDKYYHIVEIRFLPINYILDFKDVYYLIKYHIGELIFRDLNQNQEIILCELPSLKKVKIFNSVINLTLGNKLKNLNTLKLRSNYRFGLDNIILSEIHDNFHYLEDIENYIIDIYQSGNNLANFYLNKQYEYITSLKVKNCNIEVEPHLYQNLKSISIDIDNDVDDDDQDDNKVENYIFNVDASFPKLNSFTAIIKSNEITINFNNNKLPLLEKFMLLLECEILNLNHVFTNLKDLNIVAFNLDILKLSFSFKHLILEKVRFGGTFKLSPNVVNVLSDEDIKKYKDRILLPIKKSARNLF